MSSSSDTDITAVAGMTGGYEGDSVTLKCIIVLFAGLTMYNSIELIVLVFTTFSRYSGLYFWSLLISSGGLIPYALGFLFKFFYFITGNANLVSVALLSLGGYAMITGQSVVLWSRLHLIISGERGYLILKYTKWMIIVDAIVLHLSTSVVTFGSNNNIDASSFLRAYNVIEKFQMTEIFIQEAILSSIYIIETSRILKQSLRPATSRLMHQLILINIFILLMDIALLSMECASLFLLETILKGFTYSVKLKLEFAILSRLVKCVGGDKKKINCAVVSAEPLKFIVTKKTTGMPEDEQNINEVSDFVDLTKAETDYTHALSERSCGQTHGSSDPLADMDIREDYTTKA